MGNCEVKNNYVEIKKEKKNYQRKINEIKDVHMEESKINTIQLRKKLNDEEECCICQTSQEEAYEEKNYGFCLLRICKESDKHILCNNCIIRLINNRCPLCRKNLNVDICDDIRNSLNNK